MKVIQKDASAAGAKLLVVIQPGKEQVYMSHLGSDVPDPSRAIRSEMDKQRISYLDLTPTFQERAADGPALFFESDGHPNERGYELIASTVVKHLSAHAAHYGLQEITDPGELQTRVVEQGGR